MPYVPTKDIVDSHRKVNTSLLVNLVFNMAAYAYWMTFISTSEASSSFLAVFIGTAMFIHALVVALVPVWFLRHKKEHKKFLEEMDILTEQIESMEVKLSNMKKQEERAWAKFDSMINLDKNTKTNHI